MHYCVFGIDGVSLQVMENYNRLTKLGNKVHLCAADVPGVNFKELDYQSAKIKLLRRIISDTDAESDQENLIIH